MSNQVGIQPSEIIRLVNEYIGVNEGYLGDFSYRTHEEFYPVYCDLEIDPSGIQGTTRQRFIDILRTARPGDQVRIIRGILKKYPVESHERRTQELYDRFSAIAARIEGMGVDFSTIENTHDVVAHALRDAEVMIREGRPVSAVDRVHTALHGHLRYLCNAEGITLNGQETITQLYKVLRQKVPVFQPQGPHAEDIGKVLRSAAAILDALNPLRNQGTVAHPNENLLEEAEAMLVVNVSWSLLSYLDSKLGK
jgi:hypothetical protein